MIWVLSITYLVIFLDFGGVWLPKISSGGGVVCPFLDRNWPREPLGNRCHLQATCEGHFTSKPRWGFGLGQHFPMFGAQKYIWCLIIWDYGDKFWTRKSLQLCLHAIIFENHGYIFSVLHLKSILNKVKYARGFVNVTFNCNKIHK